MTLSLVDARKTIVQEVYDVDHPANASYLAACSQVPDEIQQQKLRERFVSSEVHTDPELVIERLGMASVRAGADRQRCEREVVGAGGFALDARGLKKYESLAGNPKRMAEYAVWFGMNAIEYFRHTADLCATNRMHKVALELGGKLQGGDWESTGDLDNMARLLPYQAIALRGLDGVLYEGRTRLAPKYRFMPLWREWDQAAYKRGEARWLPFDFGLIRRRRPVLDLIVQRGDTRQKIDMYKESLGLVVMAELTREQRRIVREDVRDNPRRNVFMIRNSNVEGSGRIPRLPQGDTIAATAIGGVFETDIKSLPGSSRDIVPVSAHYVMRAIRPGA